MAERICLEVSTVSDSVGMDMLGFMCQHEVQGRFSDAQLRDSKPLKWAGMDAQSFVYDFKFQGQDFHLLQLFGVTGKKSSTLYYIASADTWERHQSWIDNIERGFEVKTPPK